MTQDAAIGTDIMIVEDAGSDRAIIRHFLAALPVRTVHEAEEGRAALRLLRHLTATNNFPDALIVDCVMQPMDGLTLVREIRRSVDLGDCNVPIVMLTHRRDRETVSASLLAGADDFLVKPVAGAALVERVRRVIAKRQARRLPASVPERSTKLMDEFTRKRLAQREAAATGISPDELTAEVMQIAWQQWRLRRGDLDIPFAEGLNAFLEALDFSDLEFIDVKVPSVVLRHSAGPFATACGLTSQSDAAIAATPIAQTNLVDPVREVAEQRRALSRNFSLVPEPLPSMTPDGGGEALLSADFFETLFLPFGGKDAVERVLCLYYRKSSEIHSI